MTDDLSSLPLEYLRKGLRRADLSDDLKATMRTELAHRAKVRAIQARIATGPVYLTTTTGTALALQIERYFAPGAAFDLRQLCALLARLAPAYHRIQELRCNEPMTERQERRIDRLEGSIEARARAIVDAFPPLASGKRLGLTFTGDPRGFTIRVVVPDAPHEGNTWGRGGEFGVGAP
jgi:hypothetical protein